MMSMMLRERVSLEKNLVSILGKTLIMMLESGQKMKKRSVLRSNERKASALESYLQLATNP